MNLIHARDKHTGASVRIGITPRPNGQAELMMVHNGTSITNICWGAHLKRAEWALQERDVDAFGELIWKTHEQPRQERRA